MFKRFFPDEYVNTILDINFNKLYEEGYRGLLFDIDNTLVTYDVVYPHDELIAFFNELKLKGFKVALVSNNNKIRVNTFNEKLNVPAFYKSLKPLTTKLKKAMNEIKCKKDNTVLIGDQVFTDVYGGNRLKIKTILVSPIAEKEEWITKIKRKTEKRIIELYMKRVRKND